MFELTPVIVPRVEPPSVPPGMAGTEHALVAMRVGDGKLLDELELAWVNAFGPFPKITADMCAPDNQPDNLLLLAVQLIHGYFPDGRTAYVWAAAERCVRCWNHRSRREECRRCEGYGYMNDTGIWSEFYCDADGNVIDSDA